MLVNLLARFELLHQLSDDEVFVPALLEAPKPPASEIERYWSSSTILMNLGRIYRVPPLACCPLSAHTSRFFFFFFFFCIRYVHVHAVERVRVCVAGRPNSSFSWSSYRWASFRG